MRVLLVGPDFEDNLSIRYLSAALHEAGFFAELAAFNGPDDIDRVVAEARAFDLVGLSICFQIRALEFLELAQRLRDDSDPFIVVGGHYATCAAEALMGDHPAIDVIALHEGERTIVELARCGRNEGPLRSVAGIVFRTATGELVTTAPRPSETELDALPPPDRRGHLHTFAGVPTAWLIGSRGCVATCDYCCIVELHRRAPGKRFRQRDPDLVAREMAALYHERGARNFVFHDDNFLVPRVEANHRRIERYERAFERHGLRDIGLSLKCRPPDAERGVFERLKRLGLVRVYLGIESSSEEGLCSIGRRQTVEQSVHALDLARELGISAQFAMMVFHPDATEATVRSDLAFMRRNASFALNFCRVEIYAGTPLEARMLREGRAYGDSLARQYRVADDAIEMTCQLATEIFYERCWKMGGLIHGVIGLDHLASVARRFYARPDEVHHVRALFDALEAHRVRTNVEMVDLLEELFDAVLSHRGDPSAEALSDRVVDIARRERESRLRAEAELDVLRDRLHRFAHRRAERMFAPAPATDRRFASKLARHATAVAIALAAVTGCDDEEVQSPAEPPTAPAPPAEEPVAEPVEPEAVEPPFEEEPVLPPVELISDPEGAEVLGGDDRVLFGNTPITFTRDQLPIEIELRLQGYRPQTFEIPPDFPEARFEVALRPRPGPLPRVRPTPPPRPRHPPPPRPPYWGENEMAPFKLGGQLLDEEVQKILSRMRERDR